MTNTRDKSAIFLSGWAKYPIRWDATELESFWKKIDIQKEHDPLDHLYTSGHVVYRCVFYPTERKLILKLNIRHKVAIWVNGQNVGGNIAYGLGFLQAGAKQGPDPSSKGAHTYDLTTYINQNMENTMIILVESLGQNRGPVVLGDIRNPRGNLSIRLSDPDLKADWWISGIDVRTLSNAYNTSGLLGEQLQIQEGKGKDWMNIEEPPAIKPNDEIDLVSGLPLIGRKVKTFIIPFGSN